MNIQIKWFPAAHKDVKQVLEYKSAGASGMDIVANIARPIHIHPGQLEFILTGFALAIPEGYEGQIRSRSGLASMGIVVSNSPGTIDSDYRGEVKVVLANISDEPMSIIPGQRIAQLVICPVVRCTLVNVGQLDETVRGIGGFGSTGV